MKQNSDNQFPSAFVTYGWCRTAYTVVKSLGCRGVEVHVGDASRMAMSRFSRYCRSYHRLPDSFSNPDEFFDSVVAAMQRTGARVLFPCHEDVELFARRRSDLPEDIHLAVPDILTWQIAEDKLLYVEHVRNAGCPVPNTITVDSDASLDAALSQLSFPLVVKTRIGNSAKGVRISSDADSCRRDFRHFVKQYDLPCERWPTLQEFIKGKKLGVLGVYDRGKHVESIVFEICRSKGKENFGTSTFRVTVDDPITKQNAIRAMESLRWHGVVDMDWIRGEDGIARLIDINGRLGGATALTCFSGMDLPFLWYQIALKREPIAESNQRVNAKARWILGDMLGFIDCLRAGHLGGCFEILKPQWSCGNDDFYLHDPFPFAAQFVDYGCKFLASGGSTNPVGKGMLR